MIVLVVGTGTDVGKTHVTCALLRAPRDGGVAARAWKPVAWGARNPLGDDALAPMHVFEPPVSPHLAARAVGVRVSLDALVEGQAASCCSSRLRVPPHRDHRFRRIVITDSGIMIAPSAWS